MHHEMIILNSRYWNDKAKILRSQFRRAIFDISMITNLDTSCVLFWECGHIESVAISDTALRSYFCSAVPPESACRMVGDLKLKTVAHPPASASLILGER